ncbi:hypothetical protein [Streptomyces sp. NBC_01012]|uniref:hypothetical protein n=1 Tax=Streptomyces sp. NBC_01012 TaxID=2903717 RepID=UPI003867D1A7|nr:hypothetical protein OG623_15475 [Streptomyces sp. NBC_01012]
MNPDTTEVAAGPSALALPLALVAELAGRSADEAGTTEAGTRPSEVRTTGTGTGTGRKRRAARRRRAAVRG